MTIAQQLKIKEFPFEIKDKKGNRIYSETPGGYWAKWEYDDHGNLVYYENSDGEIVNNRHRLNKIVKVKLLSGKKYKLKLLE